MNGTIDLYWVAKRNPAESELAQEQAREFFQDRVRLHVVPQKFWTVEQIRYQPDEVFNPLGGDLSEQCREFGRTVAHREAHRRFLATNEPWALFVDEATDFPALERIKTVLGNIDIIPGSHQPVVLLGGLRGSFHAEHVGLELDTSPPLRWVSASVGVPSSFYALHQMSARKLVNAQTPIRLVRFDMIFTNPQTLEWKPRFFCPDFDFTPENCDDFA